MKKQFLLIFACVYSLNVASQVNFGIKAGTTLASYRSSTDEGIIPEYKTLAGFQGGAFARLGLSNYFSLQTELLFSTRGAKSKIIETISVPRESGYSYGVVKMGATFVPLYIDLPVYLNASFPSGNSDKFCIGAGPLFSYGIAGKAQIKISAAGENITGDIKLFSEEEPVFRDSKGNKYPLDLRYSPQKRFDAGVAGFVSYEFNQRIILCLNYQYGLKNISDDSDEDIWNRCLAISVGYKF